MIVLHGEHITEVGPADQVNVPGGAQLIDLSTATVLPGRQLSRRAGPQNHRLRTQLSHRGHFRPEPNMLRRR